MTDKNNAVQLPEPTSAEVEFAQQLVERAKADGVSLVGLGGLLAGIIRTVLESALGAELDAHLDKAGDQTQERRGRSGSGSPVFVAKWFAWRYLRPTIKKRA